jgi:hypothetical protein
MAKTQQNQFIKNLPLVIGSLGGFLLLLNRVTTPQLLDSQARSDALGIILCAALILISLLLREIQPTPPESVALIGKEGFAIDPDLSENLKTELAWATHLLLTNTVTRSIVIYYQGKVLLRRGILGENPEVKLGSMAQRVLKTQKPLYLVDLKHYPGKIEFDYLPPNIQGLICQPLDDKGIMILASNIPRSYTKQDENWIQGIAEKIALNLSLNVY